MLTPAEKEAIGNELRMLRNTIIWMVPDKFSNLIDPPYSASREDLKQWDHIAASRVVEAAEYNEYGRVPCPLCGDCPSGPNPNWRDKPETGYTDVGLERHLMGTHRQSQCRVMQAVWGLARQRHKQQWPEDFGPYGWE